MDIPALHDFLDRAFPQVVHMFEVDRVAAMEIDVILKVDNSHLRPGGTVSGPSMFALADVACYLVIMAMIGPKGLAVTTNASIDFMRKPEANRNLIAKCRLLKLGRQLAIADCLIFSEGSDKPLARANMTYSIPPAGSQADLTL